jgi:hypothetical protein
MAGAARPTGLRTYGRERLNYPTSTTAATIETRQQPLLMSWLYLFSQMLEVYRFIKR